MMSNPVKQALRETTKLNDDVINLIWDFVPNPINELHKKYKIKKAKLINKDDKNNYFNYLHDELPGTGIPNKFIVYLGFKKGVLKEDLDDDWIYDDSHLTEKRENMLNWLKTLKSPTKLKREYIKYFLDENGIKYNKNWHTKKLYKLLYTF